VTLLLYQIEYNLRRIIEQSTYHFKEIQIRLIILVVLI